MKKVKVCNQSAYVTQRQALKIHQPHWSQQKGQPSSRRFVPARVHLTAVLKEMLRGSCWCPLEARAISGALFQKMFLFSSVKAVNRSFQPFKQESGGGSLVLVVLDCSWVTFPPATLKWVLLNTQKSLQCFRRSNESQQSLLGRCYTSLQSDINTWCL